MHRVKRCSDTQRSYKSLYSYATLHCTQRFERLTVPKYACFAPFDRQSCTETTFTRACVCNML
jgi:hypothetical protein